MTARMMFLTGVAMSLAACSPRPEKRETTTAATDRRGYLHVTARHDDTSAGHDAPGHVEDGAVIHSDALITQDLLAERIPDMLRWALGFLVLAVIAAFFGYGGVATASAGIAKTLFLLFLVVAAITFIVSLFSARRTP